MPDKFRKVLQGIGKACEDKSLSEAEVEKIFQEHGFFLDLGYDGFGKDIRAQHGHSRKRFDVALLGFGGRVRTIIEFKQAGAGPLESFQEELFEKYVKPHAAQFAVLTNGVSFVLYASTNGDFVVQLNFQLSETTESQARQVENLLRKKKVYLDSLESVQQLLQDNRRYPLLISSPDSEPARVFFQVFQLAPESAFGRLVYSLKEVLPRTVASSGFTRGSYEFWQKTYARELKSKDVPASWRPFLTGTTSAEIAQFSFVLESAYTIISRLMLAKAADDRRFPGVRFVPRIQESLNELSTRERLKPENYLEVIRRSFERAGETLFHSIFSQDIFDWWFESSYSEGRVFFFSLGEAALALTQFDFSDLSGDLLGEMYQRYFDRDTRKALGEFYTPAEVIDFILDECGYRGEQGDRLLDPSCGSGSFLVAALRRYLKQNSRSAPQSLLRDLTEGLRIVGFDINPFAVLMTQVNYAALILPAYAEAIQNDPDFRIVRLPIFRTDSLRIEEREQEFDQQAKGTLQVDLSFKPGILNIGIYLPLKGEKKRFIRMYIDVPRYEDARQQNIVPSLEEYVAALAHVFQAARDDKKYPLENLLRNRFGKRAAKLHRYLHPTLTALKATIKELKDKYDDGRFLKTIEDLVLAVSLKHDLQYDFVVGNPPYVRIQNIPEHVKEYWSGKYEWTKRNYDLYIPFLERAVRAGNQEGWLGENGRLGFILSDRFLNVEYGEELRERLPETLRVNLLVDFRDTRLFADALNYPAILIAERAVRPKEGDFPAARVFSSETKFEELLSEFGKLRRKIGVEKTNRGNACEVFAFPRNRLNGPGWWLMSAEERAVFDKLRAAPGKKLIELTASQSAAFQGYSTSADKYLVFNEVEDSGNLLELLPRHRGESCLCGEKPIEIEKEALRPFLFGKDVGRWSVDWKGAWLMFPYDRYAMKGTLHGELLKGWNLIPCKENKDRFKFLEPEKIKTIETRFPKAWKYLRKHEDKLRARENHRYDKNDKNKTESHNWYGATYPRGLDYYFRPKLVLQLLSRRNSVALDGEGQFVFQAGGKGGGVYGIVPGSEVSNLKVLAAFLNTKVADFLVKETSSVYGGRFYSYADQFLKNLPVSQELLNPKSKVTDQIDSLSGNLAVASEMRRSLLDKLAAFPESFEAELSRHELTTIARLCPGHPRSARLAIDRKNLSVERELFGFAVRYGSQPGFKFEYREHAECLAQALRSRRLAKLALQDVINWRFPVKPEGCKKLLALLDEARQELGNMVQQTASEEERLNELVYKIYKVRPAERKIIEGFLSRFSSQAVG